VWAINTEEDYHEVRRMDRANDVSKSVVEPGTAA
jgi:hypothetical protein